MSSPGDMNGNDSPSSGREASQSPVRRHSEERSRSRSVEQRRSRYASKSPYRKSRDRSRTPVARRSPSRSQSRSPEPRQRRSSRYSRSPKEKKRRRYSRSRSRSRSRDRRRYGSSRGGREDPEPNRCLGVFGLSLYTSERELNRIFAKYGNIDKVQVVLDAKTGRSRGFAFVYYENVEDATDAKNSCSGMEIDGRRIRADYSTTQRPHTPTPGIYMGRPTYASSSGRSRGSRYEGGYGSYSSRRGRSPSPYRRRYRSRSRSYSPRRSRY